eukprot:GEZU01028125.1.p2 GENE.GEZU01028125.1~~GEZU01028125.1.p2  ORF type:complete len:192 (-),score=13.17 GEZU01028125.1:15-590(-)
MLAELECVGLRLLGDPPVDSLLRIFKVDKPGLGEPNMNVVFLAALGGDTRDIPPPPGDVCRENDLVAVGVSLPEDPLEMLLSKLLLLSRGAYETVGVRTEGVDTGKLVWIAFPMLVMGRWSSSNLLESPFEITKEGVVATVGGVVIVEDVMDMDDISDTKFVGDDKLLRFDVPLLESIFGLPNEEDLERDV